MNSSRSNHSSSNAARMAAVLALALCGGLTAGAFAQVAQSVPRSTPAPAASQPQQEPKSPAPSSLDDLLKIDKDKQPQPPASGEAGDAARSDDAAAQESARELQEQLSEAEVTDAFEQAVQKMSVAAELLDVRFDPGLSTQRVQEDIIAKLNQLLDQAKKNKSQSSSSSSSSSSKQQQRQQDPGKRQQQQNQQNAQSNPNPADNRSEIDPPEMQQGDVNTVIEETRSEWGNLPQRIRDQMLQGQRDYMPPLYKHLIDEYYKRLAEENSP